MDEINTNEVESQFPQSEEEKKQETKAEKFQRLGTARVNKIITELDKLGNLSSSNYEYTQEQVDKMYNTIQSALNDSKEAFEKKQKKKEKFVFD